MATFTMTDHTDGDTGPGKVHIGFTADGPARFELIVDSDGHVHLLGYSGCHDDESQDPNLVFDTDGSQAVFTDAEA